MAKSNNFLYNDNFLGLRIVMSDVMVRRFAGTQKLYGSDGFDKFCQAHVYVIGVGGVGEFGR